jgi:hypothetical protein
MRRMRPPYREDGVGKRMVKEGVDRYEALYISIITRLSS